ncbi:MAG: transcriptional repressor [bacterium]|nr:transcriptional repressor [bacterium]
MTTDPRDLLRAHGLQVTAQRLAVLRAVSAHPHATADEVAAAVRDEIGSVSKQTVYDALRALASKGLIGEVHVPGSAARFDPRTGDNHHHAICRQCGAMVDVDCVIGQAPCIDDNDSGFEIDEAQVTFWGTCPACRAKTGTAESEPGD